MGPSSMMATSICWLLFLRLQARDGVGGVAGDVVQFDTVLFGEGREDVLAHDVFERPAVAGDHQFLLRLCVCAQPGRDRRGREHCKYLAHENPRILEENCKNRLICCPATSCPPYNLSVHECPDK